MVWIMFPVNNEDIVLFTLSKEMFAGTLEKVYSTTVGLF